MIGMDRRTGETLGGDAHLAQSIADILTTPVGSRVMRRDYGSRIPDLIDAPLNGETIVLVYAAAAEALARWEPRLKLLRMSVESAAAGRLALGVVGEAEGRALETGVLLVGGGRP